MRWHVSPKDTSRQTSENSYVELNSPRDSSEKWWRNPEWWRNPQEASSRAADRPSKLILTAIEVTAEGLERRLTVSRDELIASQSISAEELRNMLLVGVVPSIAHHLDPTHSDDPAEHLRGIRRPSNLFTKRNGALLLQVDTIRAIVENERVLIFGRSDDNHDFLGKLRASAAVGGCSFQLHCADCALLVTIRKLDSSLCKVREVSDAVIRTSTKLETVRLREMDLERIRVQRLALLKCLSQASDVASSLLDNLKNLDKVLGTNLEDIETQEWVTMLEIYLQAYSECSDECKQLLGVIENFEESTGLAMQARRLHIEEFELILVIAAVSISAGAAIPGIWGMNLKNGYEETNDAFLIAIIVTILVAITLFTIIRCLATWRGIFN